jgi:methionine synthase I (cobalamin-dependent)
LSHPFIDGLVRQAPIITDGAWGTQLQVRGLPLGDTPDLWNLSHPDAVSTVAAAYVAAGAQIILTNTFGANRFRLAKAADMVREINQAGVALSRQAASSQALVFASMGPSGKQLHRGDINEKDLAAAFAEQAKAIAGAEPDGIVIETMQDIQEAAIAITAAKATGLPVVATMAFYCGKDHDRTLTGVTPEQAAEALAQAGADVIGANCGEGIAGFITICARLKAASQGLPIWIKANADLPTMENGKAVYAMTAEDFAAHVPALITAGANFIGGCCGTTPAFVTAMKTALRRA